MKCPRCNTEMDVEDKTSFTGNYMSTHRCANCGHSEIVDGGKALWEILSEANEAAKKSKVPENEK